MALNIKRKHGQGIRISVAGQDIWVYASEVQPNGNQIALAICADRSVQITREEIVLADREEPGPLYRAENYSKSW